MDDDIDRSLCSLRYVSVDNIVKKIRNMGRGSLLACKVVRPGLHFLRGMFALLSGSRRGHYYIRLNRQFRADLQWWNGKSMLSEVYSSNSNVHIVSDVSGSWGCTAYWNGECFQVAWSDYPEF